MGANPSSEQEQEWELLSTAIARLRASVMAMVFGLATGIGLFVATVWLLIRTLPPETVINYFREMFSVMD